MLSESSILVIVFIKFIDRFKCSFFSQEYCNKPFYSDSGMFPNELSCIGTSSLWYLDDLMNIWTSLLSTQNNVWVSKAFVICEDSLCISSLLLHLRIQTSRYRKNIVKRLYRINLKGKIIQNMYKLMYS